MCDPSFYVPLAQAAEAAGFDTIAVPDSIAYPKDVVVDATRTTSTAPASSSRTSRSSSRTVAIAAMAAVTSTIEFHTFVLKLPIRHPVIYAKEATSLAVITRQPLRARRRLEPVARRLRDRPAAVGRARPAFRRVHRDRARPRGRRLLRVPRRVLRLPGDQDGAGAVGTDPGAHRRSRRRQPPPRRAPRRRLDGRRRHDRRPDPDDRPHERPAPRVRPRARAVRRSTPPRPSRSPPTASSGSRTSVSRTPRVASVASTRTGSRPTPRRLQEKIDNLDRYADEVIAAVR